MKRIDDWYLHHKESGGTGLSGLLDGKRFVFDIVKFDLNRNLAHTDSHIYELGKPNQDWQWYVESRGFGIEDEIKCLFE